MTDPSVLDTVIEALASVEHERWAHWQRYLHDQCVPFGDDGALLIPGDLVRQWSRQIETPYEALAEDEKVSDRAQVRRYLPILEEMATALKS